MKIATIAATSAAALALAACQQPTTEPTDASAENAAAASDAATDAAARAGATGTGSIETTLPPEEADEVPAPVDPAPDTMGGPSETTRAGAQEKAESTNLRP